MQRYGTIERHSEIIGLPVICVPGGKVLGIVRDVAFCNKERRAKAIFVENVGIRRNRWLISMEDIEKIGKDAVIIDDIEKKKKVKEKAINSGEIKDMKVYSKSGWELGVIKDILFDCKTGNIEGVEVSEGIYQDLSEGRKIIPLIGKYEFGEDMLLVDNDAIEEAISTGGGIKNKFFKNLQ
ncbi:MAG TPA: photosystem reaction center subunit H [Clostridiaceae bacterium]|jgi:uncharacterized protein YrrD|nr:photosystem reaction center subunit H [Clostridiaceae bacterium]